MESTITTAIITAGGTIIGAAIGAILSKSDFVNNIFAKKNKRKLGKKLESTWIETISGADKTYSEIFYIKKERKRYKSLWKNYNGIRT
jgi:hypothetical protein